jgi:hypothetical protein
MPGGYLTRVGFYTHDTPVQEEAGSWNGWGKPLNPTGNFATMQWRPEQ